MSAEGPEYFRRAPAWQAGAMTYECFDIETTDQVAHLRMIRPERSNSMIPSFWRELPDIVDGLSAGGRIRALVLSAEGRHFCSGMDLEVFANDDAIGPGGGRAEHRSRRNERFRSTAMKLQDTFTALERARMPVLCAIQGACVGGGVDLVCAADLRYAEENAFFSIAEINIGMTADVGTLQRMPKLVPEGIVRELAYTGRRWSAAEAHAAGFVNAVFPDHDALLAGVLTAASEIAAKSPMAVWGTKQTLHYTRDHSVADGLEYVANWNAAMFDTDDMGEAFRAKVDQRKGEFPDLVPLSEGL
ncbi:MAG: crotonase/enoyl-CoA hydratase family protein [Acidimicrobiia bacterium]